MNPAARLHPAKANSMRAVCDYVLWPALGLVVFWIGYGVALKSAAPNAPYCRDTVGVIQWPALAYMPVALIGSTLASRRSPWRRRMFLVAWNVGSTGAVLFVSYLAAFAGVGPHNCGI
jgi:hypothetical protein